MSEQVIWKFDILQTHTFGIEMPEGSEILTIDIQNGRPQLWALVDPTKEKLVRIFSIRGTGNAENFIGWQYIGTFQQPPMVWHLFEQAVTEKKLPSELVIRHRPSNGE